MLTQELLNRFQGVKQNKPNQWQCRCPAHDDKEPSLTITETEDRYLVYCHAGCSLDSILSAVGLSKSDLFKTDYRNAKISWQQGLQNRYDYYNEEGKYVFSKLRYKDKKFKAGVISGDYCDFKAVPKEKPLYNLKDLLAVKDSPGAVVYLCEGEKDCQTMQRLGFTAVSVTNGAKTWRSEYTKYFADTKLVILQDNDSAGDSLTTSVVKDVADVVRAYKVVITSEAEHGDITDYITKERHTRQELLNLVESVAWRVKGKEEIKPLNFVQASDLMAKEIPPAVEYVKGLLLEGLTILSAPAKAGKSWLALELSLSLVQGKSFLGCKTKKSNVVYLALEDSQRRIKNRLQKLQGNVTVPNGLYIVTPDSETEVLPLNHGLKEQLEQLLNSEDIGTIIIDTYQKVRPPQNRQTTAYELDYKALGEIQTLALQKHVSIVVIHHTKKASAGNTDAYDLILGSTAIQGVSDTMLVLVKDRNATDNSAVLHITGRDVEPQELALAFDKDSCSWSNLGDLDSYTYERDKREYKASVLPVFIKEMLNQGNGKYQTKLKPLWNDLQKFKGELVGENEQALGRIIKKYTPYFAEDCIEFESRKTTVNGDKGLYYTFRYI